MIAWSWRPGLCTTAVLNLLCPPGAVAAGLVSKQFGTRLTTHHLN